MMLMSALLVGFTTVVMSDQRYRLIDRDRVRSFYAAHSGRREAERRSEAICSCQRRADGGADRRAEGQTRRRSRTSRSSNAGDAAYGVTLEPPPLGCANPCSTTISTGPYAGLIALKKIYRLDATARTADGGETHLMRKVETVSIPVFQFGMFSDIDLSFHAGPNFNFGGRVHSNGNLFLAQGDGATLTLPRARDRGTRSHSPAPGQRRADHRESALGNRERRHGSRRLQEPAGHRGKRR